MERSALAGTGPLAPELEPHDTIRSDRPDKLVPAGFERNSSISDILDILAEPWTFLIVREAFFGCKRFSEFEANLGIPRATLSKSLALLVDRGLFEAKVPDTGSTRKRYYLSERGIDLYPVLLGLMWFGDKWMSGDIPPVALFHKPCRSWISPEIVWSHNARAVDARTVTPQFGPDYWRPRTPRTVRSYGTANRRGVRGHRPCNIERTLSVVGDRWTFLIFQECFHGIRRFDDFVRNIGIASNILSKRLSNLVAHDFLQRRAQGQYTLTPKGMDIYGPMIILKNWGDKWLRDADRPSWWLVDSTTGVETAAMMACPQCHREIAARDVAYTTTY